jgi:hypothetical protein
MDAMSFEQENAYIQMALHDIEDRRGPQRESVQVFREFYRALKLRMEPKEIDWGPPVGREIIDP